MKRIACILLLLLTGCAAGARHGDQIVVCGKPFRTGTPVVLWTDPGGYDAYQPPTHFGDRKTVGDPGRLDVLQGHIDQFVIHYDVSGLSRECFRTLHDRRGLSVHFLLDLDGTIYQTLDLKERAWHATTSNDRSIGIEIANVGAYAPGERSPFARWYAPGPDGWPVITIPPALGDGGIRTKGFVGRPIRPELVTGTINGRTLQQYDLTPQQYASLVHLTAALCRVFPRLRCDYPRDASGRLVMGKLPDDVLSGYTGLIGHWHIQEDKVDPGPAFQWDLVVRGAASLMRR